ncbi:MAG: patatin-like phospholipase family protein [Planctomycetes bacterium]|nr:patatin-like phospholipase family protein [Planctomycetota bacterium]MBI3836060.1 patatin-like phospholipase family protein [Planctomycetota bacterium]
MKAWIVYSIVVISIVDLAGCGAIRRRHCEPAELADKALPLGIPGLRAWGDEFSPTFQASVVDSVRQEIASGEFNPHAAEPGKLDLLALSGGGANGAYGAGLLCGWTAAGTRPKFKLVTGISTGALIAPFAFLGPEYDDRLEHFYTHVTSKDIFREKHILSALRSDSLADTTPLAKLLEREVNDDVIAKIAVEHQKGRRLFVGTTHMDAQRPVVWDMGAIAACGHPDAPKLFRSILLASASIPVAFPPVYIDVDIDGRHYDEMHVDGGVVTQVFLYGPMLKPVAARKELGLDSVPRKLRVFIIRNSRIANDWQPMLARLLPIAGRAVDSLIKFQGVGDIYRIYAEAERDNVEFNFAYIPHEFKGKSSAEFDPVVMSELFKMGFERAKNGYSWDHVPPGFDTGG